MPNPKAIIFDVDETLLHEETTERRAFELACSGLRTGASLRRREQPDVSQMCDLLFATAEELWRENPVHAFTDEVGISCREGLWGVFSGPCPELNKLSGWIDTYRHRCWGRVCGALGLPADRIPGTIARSIALRNRHHVAFDDTEEGLEVLGQRHRLGILTNGAPEVQRAKISGAGIARYFDHIVVSGDVCRGKPHPDTFSRIVHLMGVPSGACLMVGDSYEKDVVGARACGLEAVWIDRRTTDTDLGEAGTRERCLRNLTELICTLEDE